MSWDWDRFELPDDVELERDARRRDPLPDDAPHLGFLSLLEVDELVQLSRRPGLDVGDLESANRIVRRAEARRVAGARPVGTSEEYLYGGELGRPMALLDHCVRGLAGCGCLDRAFDECAPASRRAAELEAEVFCRGRPVPSAVVETRELELDVVDEDPSLDFELEGQALEKSQAVEDDRGLVVVESSEPEPHVLDQIDQNERRPIRLVDLAAASRGRPFADGGRWSHGDAEALQSMSDRLQGRSYDPRSRRTDDGA